MFKRTVSYTDFDGQQQTEEVYFHLSRTKVIDMALTGEADELLQAIQEAVKSQDGKEIVRTVRDLIHLAYGEKDADGKTFRQGEELSDDFFQTAVFDQFFYDMIMDPQQVNEFVEALFPPDFMEEARQKAAAQGLTIENLALPREDGQAYYDQSKAERLRRQPQDHLPKQVKDVELPATGPLTTQPSDADMSDFLEWKRQQNS